MSNCSFCGSEFGSWVHIWNLWLCGPCRSIRTNMELGHPEMTVLEIDTEVREWVKMRKSLGVWDAFR